MDEHPYAARHFVNEGGNAIDITVALGKPGCLCRMMIASRSSCIESYTTRMELEQLRDAINEVLPDTAARLAVVPVPDGDVVEAVENVMLRYDADMKLGDNADACRDDLVALIAAEREACAVIAARERADLVSWLREWAATRQLGLTPKSKDICAQAILACAQRIERGEDAAIRAGGRHE